MVVPDYELIAEIMLVAEGFINARILARKFLTLYTLCKELLSKQDHYDWGLRAIKSVLVVAGSLKRGDRGRPEDQVIIDISLPGLLMLFIVYIIILVHFCINEQHNSQFMSRKWIISHAKIGVACRGPEAYKIL